MVSTYTSYNSIINNLLVSLNRVSEDSVNAREESYFKENIAKVTSVDEFLDDYRLYSYAMKAYGLEEMTYATAFMRKVLESDTTDESSFVNMLSDNRYRDFALAFNFQEDTATAQTDAQLDDVIGLYTASVEGAGAAITEENRYYNIVIDEISSVDELLQNDRMRDYVFSVFGIDESTYSYSNVKNVLTSDYDDENSYVNTTYLPYIEELEAKVETLTTKLSDSTLTTAEKTAIRTQISTYNGYMSNAENMLALSAAFNFNTDGTVPTGETAQTEEQKATMNEAYTLSTDRVTSAAALLNQAYFEEQIASITTVDELISDDRLLSYIKTSYNLTSVTVVSATIENILTSDPDDPDSYVNTFGGGDENYLALARAFNFQDDGTLATGDSAQTAAQTKATKNLYMSRYNDADDEADETLIANYKSDMSEVTSVSDFIDSDDVYTLALTAFGLDPDTEWPYRIKQVLMSDLNDPNSYVYKLKDERYVELAKAFNFDSEGNIDAPVLAQGESEILAISKAYVVEKSRFATEDEQTAAEEEATYYSEQMQSIESVDDLLSNSRLTDFILEAYRIDPETVDEEFLRNIFSSDLDDPDSFVNQQSDRSYRQIVASFNFDEDGNVVAEETAGAMSRRGIYETIDNYVRQMMEENAGDQNAAVRLALYFERTAPTISSAYSIIADDALYEVFRTTFEIADEVANSDVDAQAEMIERYLDLEDLQDPEKVQKLIVRFCVLYDSENMTDQSGALTLLSGTSGNISADTLLSMAQLKTGGL
ncbi:DUF1217 domain-containing protein [Sinorhizobium sp. BG8]|uniref:DUF1217 domain-containing protein n=1 Tax=Sinorhizobium sp. BG8 TaxID=2613773 RepID=UPI00193E4EE5|nr:DUF1217 domain-containing protein [Sinorhizobium sp. BG8]QRM54528.1 DUF1217 domain-containing protein [Sinorhizobium sp. BG8]